MCLVQWITERPEVARGWGGAAAQGGKRQMFLYMYSQERSNS